MWMLWRKTECYASIYNVFPESQGNVGNTFFWSFCSNWIEVERASYARKRWIKVIFVILSNNFLYYNAHFFLVNHIACGGHVGFAVFVIDRSVHSFNSFAQYHEHVCFTFIAEWHHVCGVNSSKWLIVRIF